MGQWFRSILVWAALLVVGSAGNCAAAQPERGSEALQSRRLVALFDFEETIEGKPLGRFERLPMHWYVMGQPDGSSDPNFLGQPLHQQLMLASGYSRHSEVRFDTRHRISGEFSFFLGLDSGSSGAFLQTGVLPAMADIDYRIHCKVRTTDLTHASARLIAYFVDGKGNRIDASVVSSPPIRTAGQWQDVSVRLMGMHRDAAWIGLQLEVLQAQPDEHAALGDKQIVLKEVAGGAWFDDVAVWQMPHVQLRTQSAVNIIRPPQRPQLAMEVRDLTGQALVAQVSVYDHALERVATQTRHVGAGEPSVWSWTPPLDRFGWYLVDMQVRAADAPAESSTPFIARNMLALLYLGEERTLDATDAAAFVIRAEDLPVAELALLPELLEATRLGGAVVSAWDRDTSLAQLDARHSVLEPLIHDIAAQGGRVTLSLFPLPDELSHQLGISGDAPIDLFAPEVDPVKWTHYLTPITLQFGQRVRHWQIGASDRTLAFHRAELPRHTAVMTNLFANLIPQPVLIMPWQISQSRRDDVRQRPMMALNVPIAVRPQDLPAYTADWLREPALALRLDLQTPPATQVHHPRRIDDLVQRMVHGWRAGAAAMTLPRAWTLAEDRQTRLTPDPLLGVYSTVAHRLAGRRFVGDLPLGPGLKAMILDGKGGGALVAWNQFAPQNKAFLDMYLGEQPYTVDVFGNREPIALVNGTHRVTLGATPIFIEGIDARLALFRAHFAIDEPFIESTQTVHRRTVTIHNPWKRTITGQMRIVEPENWQIQPRLSNFSIASGESATVELAIKFPVSETAGDKRLIANFDLSAEEHYNVDVATDVDIGLRNVDFESNVVFVTNSTTGERDAVVTQFIANTGNEPISLYAFANLAGHPRQERLISHLKPGQTVTRRFTFASADAALAEHAIRAGIREANGPAVLTHLLEPE